MRVNASRTRSARAVSPAISRTRTGSAACCLVGWAASMGLPLYPPGAGGLRRLTNTHVTTSRRASGYHSGRQTFAKTCDFTRTGPPHLRRARMLDAVPQGAAQAAHAERLSEHVRVHRNVHHQRVALALLAHLVELVDDHVAEIGRVLLAVDDDLGVVQLDGIGHRKDGARARAQPHWLVVHRPVHEVL